VHAWGGISFLFSSFLPHGILLLSTLSLLVLHFRWTYNVKKHLAALASWLKHPWRAIRRRHYLRVRAHCFHEWLAVAQELREKRATHALHVWKHEAARICFIQRAASSDITAVQRFMASWLMREWKRLTTLVRRVVALVEARETRFWQQHWEAWVFLSWKLRFLARWIFRSFADYGNLTPDLPCVNAIDPMVKRMFSLPVF
jgi:hypothetical protein